MGSARTRVLIVCGAGTRAQRKAPDPGTQLPTPTERPRCGGTVPCPRSHNGDGNRGWEVKSPGSRWEACRNPSRSRLAGGSSVQFLLACQPLVHRRGEINRSRRQRFGELGAPRKCFTIMGVALNSLVSCPRYVAFCWGVRGLKGWVFMRRGYTLSRFFYSVKTPAFGGTQLRGCALQSRLFPSPKPQLPGRSGTGPQAAPARKSQRERGGMRCA